MKKSPYKKRYPPLVVIDTKKCIYNRYVGKECTNIIESSELLSAENVEMFRLNPTKFISWCSGGEEKDFVNSSNPTSNDPSVA